MQYLCKSFGDIIFRFQIKHPPHIIDCHINAHHKHSENLLLFLIISYRTEIIFNPLNYYFFLDWELLHLILIWTLWQKITQTEKDVVYIFDIIEESYEIIQINWIVCNIKEAIGFETVQLNDHQPKTTVTYPQWW